MSIIGRTKLIFRIKTHAALDQFENPVETLDYAELQQRELLRKVGQGLIEVATARQRLSRQAEALRAQIPRFEEQAKRALEADREDLARTALMRKQTALAELTDLEREIVEVTSEETSLTAAHQQLEARVGEFRRQRLTTSARYQSASARVTVSEALSGVSDELAELGMAVGRAEERTERMQARAAALDALIASGALAAPLGKTDLVERELREIAAKRAVDEELAALKGDG